MAAGGKGIWEVVQNDCSEVKGVERVKRL